MARCLFPLTAAGLAVVAVFAGCGPSEFRLSGTVTIASNLQARAPRQDCVLFIIAKNLGGVPLAVKRVVNPQFPVGFVLGPQDLVIPGTHPKDSLRLEVELNRRGNVGSPRRGDLVGAAPDPAASGDRGVHIVIDRQF